MVWGLSLMGANRKQGRLIREKMRPIVKKVNGGRPVADIELDKFSPDQRLGVQKYLRQNDYALMGDFWRRVNRGVEI